MPHIESEQTSGLRRRDRAARVAVEELTGLALQERGLSVLLARQAGEAPLGGPRERLEGHLKQSREHAELFDDRARALRAHRGGGELLAGLYRSGFALVGSVAATVAQVATLPLALVRRGGGEERLLENTGVEGAAVANKLVILTAVTRALELAGDTESHRMLRAVRDETQATLDELLAQTPTLMGALVGARAQESSYDFRTTGVRDALFDRMGPGHASGFEPDTGPARGAVADRYASMPAKNGTGATS